MRLVWWALIQSDQSSYKKKKNRKPGKQVYKEKTVRTQQEGSHLQARNEASELTEPPDT